MPVKLNSSGGGSITLDVPSMSTANTLTLPAKTGNIITSADSGTITQGMLGSGLAGTGPAFSAYQSSTQSNFTTPTKVSLQTEEYDTANCFDSTTNYRFTPNIAGYYQFNASVQFNGSTQGGALFIYKNGSSVKQSNYNPATVTDPGVNLSALIYLNGTTDYVELYASSATSVNLKASSFQTYFNGFLARAA